ncbi:MAG: carboxypeptidase-like regulatory domain-containing protein [Planctomycetota bacterium]
MRWIIVLLMALLLGAAAFWLLDSDSASGPRQAEAVSVRSDAPSGGSSILDREATSSGRDDVASDPLPLSAPDSGAPPGGTETQRAEPSPSSVTGVDLRCIDVTGNPLQGILLRHSEDEPIESDSEGHIAWRTDVAPKQRRASFILGGTGWATRRLPVTLEPGTVTSLGDITLQPGGGIEGRIQDDVGQPEVDRAVHAIPADLREQDEREALLEGPQGFSEALHQAHSDVAGRFRLEGMAPGWYRLWSRGNPGQRWATTEAIEVRPGATVQGVVLTLEPLTDEDRIEGIVYAPDGTPSPMAQIQYQYRAGGRSGSGSLQANEEGRFQRRTPFRGLYRLTASDPKGELGLSETVEAEPGDHDVELWLRERVNIEVLVQDSRKQPVSSYDVRFTAEDGRQLPNPNPTFDSDRPGVSRFAAPSTDFTLVIDAEGYELAEQGPFSGSAPPSRTVVSLRRLPGVHGRVTAGDEPVAGATVGLYEVVGDRDALTVNGFAALTEPWPKGEAKTNDDGEYTLWSRESGTFFVRASHDDFAMSEIGPFPLDPETGADGLDLELTGGGRLRVRVVGTQGLDPNRIIVGVSRGDGHAMTRQLGPDGTVTFERLTPGPWHVTQRQELLDPNRTSSSRSSRDGEEQVIPSNCVVVDGRLTELTLDIQSSAARVDGRLTFDGRAPAGWKASIDAENAPVQAAVRPDGTFELMVSEPGRYRLLLSGSLAGGAEMNISEEIEIGETPTPWAADLLTGTIEGRVGGPAPGRARLTFNGIDPDGRRLWANATIGDDGHYRISGFPASEGMLHLNRPDEDSDQKRTTIEAGETVQRDFE